MIITLVGGWEGWVCGYGLGRVGDFHSGNLKDNRLL